MTENEQKIYAAIFGPNWKAIIQPQKEAEKREDAAAENARYNKEVQKKKMVEAEKRQKEQLEQYRLDEQKYLNEQFKKANMDRIAKAKTNSKTPSRDMQGYAASAIDEDGPTLMTKEFMEDRMKQFETTPDISVYSDKYNSFDVSVSYTKSGKSDDYSALLISLPVIGREKKDVSIKQTGVASINVKSVLSVKDPYPVNGAHEPVIATNNSSRFQSADHNSSDDLKSRFNFDFDITVEDDYDLSTLTAHLDQGLMYIFIDVKDKYEPGYFDIS